jgi:hypothetical protein
VQNAFFEGEEDDEEDEGITLLDSEAEAESESFLARLIGNGIGIIYFVIYAEIGIWFSRWCWNAVGPISLLWTFEFWWAYPFWYAWRWALNALTGWGL